MKISKMMNLFIMFSNGWIFFSISGYSVDAFRIEILDDNSQGAGAAMILNLVVDPAGSLLAGRLVDVLSGLYRILFIVNILVIIVL